jgi:hypothetical protein
VAEIGRLSSELRAVLGNLKRGASADAMPAGPNLAGVLCEDENEDAD